MGQNGVLIDSYCPSPKFSGTFYGITKTRSVAELWHVEISKNGEILYILRIFKFSFRDLGKSLIFDPKSISGPNIAYWAKLLHFMGFPNVTWEFLRF